MDKLTSSLILLICMQINLRCSQVVSQHLPGYPPASYQRDSNSNRARANIFARNDQSADQSDYLGDYSDEVYKELAAEYQDNLRMSAEAVTVAVAAQHEDEDADDRIDTAGAGDKASMGKRDKMKVKKKKKKKEESYEEMVTRLKCDNPWFWNAPKCTWLDVRNKNVRKRTKHNAKVSAWLIGGVSSFLLLWLCSIYCFHLMKVRNRARLQRLRDKYRPGRLELASGKVVEYEANAEEEKAYEELMRAIIVQEMAYMI